MPQISQCTFQIPKSISPKYSQVEKISSKSPKIKNDISKFKFFPFKCQKEQNIDTNKALNKQNIYRFQAPEQPVSQNKPKISTHRGISVSRKLFEKAKIIRNPQRQTYLSPQFKCTEKHLLTIPSQNQVKNSRFNIVKMRSEKTLKTKSNNEPNEQKLNHLSEISSLSKNSKTRTEGNQSQQQKLFVDENEKKHIKNNNLFKSSKGQQILMSLQNKFNDISSIKRKPSSNEKKQIIQQKQQNNKINTSFKVQKIVSIEMNDQNQSFSNLKNESCAQNNKLSGQQMGSSFSKLIMNNLYTQSQDRASLSDLIEQDQGY